MIIIRWHGNFAGNPVESNECVRVYAMYTQKHRQKFKFKSRSSHERWTYTCIGTQAFKWAPTIMCNDKLYKQFEMRAFIYVKFRKIVICETKLYFDSAFDFNVYIHWRRKNDFTFNIEKGRELFTHKVNNKMK